MSQDQRLLSFPSSTLRFPVLRWRLTLERPRLTLALPRLTLALALVALFAPSASHGLEDGATAALSAGERSAIASLTTGDRALEPATTGGVEALDRALAKLSTHRRLLVVAAHPDDEDTAVLSYVSRHLGGEAAYLSLSRGEGGQNLIGQELGVGLGLIRAGELAAARSVDGARQFYSRAYDFGFTRSLDETFQRWPQEVLLEDGLRVVRRFKPQVIVSVFPADPRAGHGQHQAAGVIAKQLFDSSADPDAAPSLQEEDLYAWPVESFFYSGWWSRDEEAVTFSLGEQDPVRGKSMAQIARESRSRHRSQDMGNLEPLGSVTHRLLPAGGANLELDLSASISSPEGPFAGIDTRLRALAAVLEDDPRRQPVEIHLDRVEALARQARDRLSPQRLGSDAVLLTDLQTILAELSQAHAAVAKDPGSSAGAAVRELLDEKIAVATEAFATAAGLAADSYTSSDRLIPGGELTVEALVFNGGSRPITLAEASLLSPQGWSIEAVTPAADELPRGAIAADPQTGLTLEPESLATYRFRITLPTDASPTLPYFLQRPLQGDLYDWSQADPGLRGEPFDPALLRFQIRLASGDRGEQITLEREVVTRQRDQAFGEVRDPLRVVPAVEVGVEPELLVKGAQDSAPAKLNVRLSNLSSEELDLQVLVSSDALAAPMQAEAQVPGNEQKVLPFELSLLPGLASGSYPITVKVKSPGAGAGWTRAYPEVRYPHVRPHPRPLPASTELAIGDFTLPRLQRIGYVRGASDRVPEALQRLGLPVEELSGSDLEVGDLEPFDVIVIGSRAYEISAALREANTRLLRYAREGGTVIVQYQQYQFSRGGFAPFEIEIRRPHDRVTDEVSPVTVLEPKHPILTYPNLIQPQDWDGWVQERGLYFFGQWSPELTPLLEMQGADGKPQQGGLLIAPLGEGTYIYTGLAFFRQLPAGVVGAYRLMLNLLAVAESSEPAGDQSSE
ncbi:MAG: PIG-L family deacetylase [Acidobacteriota bacterium]